MTAFDPTDLTIPGLGAKLAVVPPPPSGPDDPAGEEKRAAWFAWKEGVEAYRVKRWWDCGERVDGVTGRPLNPKAPRPHEDDIAEARWIEAQLCRTDPAYEQAIWCAIHETRGGWGRAKGWQPAIPYGFQVKALRWLDWRLALAEEGEGGALAVWSKCRTVGASWSLAFWLRHHWGWLDAFFGKLVSRKEALVDSHSLDSLFARITAQFDHVRGAPAGNPLAMPKWLWPKGFDPATHKTDLLLKNPERGNEVNGEATTATTGRGGRATFAGVDEGSFIQGLQAVLAAMGETVGLTLVVSSESIEVSDEFGHLADAARDRADGSLLETDWWEHPHYTTEWLAQRRAAYEARGKIDAFYREIVRDRRAGLTGFAYPTAWDLATGDFPYVKGAPLWVTIDPGFDDECAVHWLSRDPNDPGRVRLVRSYANRAQVPEFYAALIAGVRLDQRDDPELPWRFGEDELDLIDWVNTALRPSFVYGDPAGGQNTSGKKTSWYDKMAVFWAKHGWVKAVSYKDMGKDARPFQTRRTALRDMLPRLDFHHGDGVPETLTAIKESRFDPSDDRATEQKALRHDKYSHRRSALEFFAVWHPRTEVLVGADWSVVRQKKRRTAA